MGKVLSFFLGMLTGAAVLAGGVAAAAAFIPSKTYLNAGGKVIVGDNIGNRGLFDLISNVNSYTFNDVPILEETINNLVKEGGLGDYVTLDYEQIRNVTFTDPSLSEKLKGAITISATLRSLNVDLGNLGNLSIFNEYTAVTPSAQEIADNPKVFYYASGTNVYARAYDDQGSPVTGYDGSGQLYLPALSSVVVTDLFVPFAYRIGEITYKDFMITLMGSSEEALQSDTIYKLIGNKKLRDLKDLDAASFHLVDVLEYQDSNAKLYQILLDIQGKENTAENRATITIGSLSSIDVNKIHLSTFLPVSQNQKLYDILADMTGVSDASTITVNHLSDASNGIDNIKLSTVLGTSSNNIVLNALLENGGVTIGNIGTKINQLSLHDLYGEACFTSVASDAKNADTYRLVDGKYVYDPAISAAETTYYVSKTAGVWLLLSYTVDNVDIADNGRANVFNPTTVTFADLQGEESPIAGRIGDSTVYQLISAGIVNDGDYSDNVKRLTLSGLLAMVGA